MSNHDWCWRLLLFRELKKLSRKHGCSITVEVHKFWYEETVEDGVKKQRVFDVLPQTFRLLDHDPGLVERRYSLGYAKSLAMIQSVRKSDLKLDLLPAQRGRCRQRRNLVKAAREFGPRFKQCGAL